MNMKLIKAFRDLQINPRRTALVLFALILGIWGVGTVSTAYLILNNDLNRNYQQTIPPHLILYSEDFGKLDLVELIKQANIESAEFRDVSLHRIEVRPNVWMAFYLNGVDDFENFQLAKFFHEEGKVIPDSNTILIERDGLRLSYLELDSISRIRVNDTILEVMISGIAFDPAQAPATQENMVYAFADKNTFQKITGSEINQRLILRFNNVESQEEVKIAANDLGKEFDRQGIQIGSKRIPPFNEHPHQWQLNTILFLVGAIGLLAFIMSAVLVSQLMGAIMVSQIRQIGIFKATGASRFQIMKIYLLMLLLLGATAGIIATPLAILAGKAFAVFISQILNFNIYTSPPIWLWALIMTLSLALPILVSLGKLLNGTRISVREALSDYGITNEAGSLKLTWLKSLKLPNPIILAIRNSLRNRQRLTVTIITMALGVAIFSTGFNVRQSLWNFLSNLDREMNFDVQVILDEKMDREAAFAPFETLENLETIGAWNGGSGRLQSNLVGTEEGVGVVALPYNSPLLKPHLIEGKWLSGANKSDIVLNQKAWAFYGNPEIGSSLTLEMNGKVLKVTLVGIVEQFDLGKIYLDQSFYTAQINPDKKINTLLFVAKDGDFGKVMALKKNIEDRIANSELDVVVVMSHAEKVRVIYAHLNIILSTILILSFLVLLVSAVGMASAMGINIWERTREIGVMRAIGATPKKIQQIFINEGLITSIVSILLGLLLSYPLSKLAAVFFGNLMLGEGSVLRYAFSSTGFWVTLIVTLVFGWLASKVPARNAIKVSTREALAYE